MDKMDKIDTTTYILRSIPKEDWMFFQIACRRQGTTAAAKLREFIAREAEKER